MTKKLTVALDCDGCLFDCDDYVRRLAQRIVGDSRELPKVSRFFEFEKAFELSALEMQHLNELVCESSATREMEWLTGAQEFVDVLLEQGHDVFFLTSHWRGAERWVTQRERRLAANWPDLDVVFTHNKTRAQFDLLLDDKLSTVLAVGERGVLFDQPWNQDAPAYVRRVKSYFEFLNLTNGA